MRSAHEHQHLLETPRDDEAPDPHEENSENEEESGEERGEWIEDEGQCKFFDELMEDAVASRERRVWIVVAARGTRKSVNAMLAAERNGWYYSATVLPTPAVMAVYSAPIAVAGLAMWFLPHVASLALPLSCFAIAIMNALILVMGPHCFSSCSALCAFCTGGKIVFDDVMRGVGDRRVLTMFLKALNYRGPCVLVTSNEGFEFCVEDTARVAAYCVFGHSFPYVGAESLVQAIKAAAASETGSEVRFPVGTVHADWLSAAVVEEIARKHLERHAFSLLFWSELLRYSTENGRGRRLVDVSCDRAFLTRVARKIDLTADKAFRREAIDNSPDLGAEAGKMQELSARIHDVGSAPKVRSWGDVPGRAALATMLGLPLKVES